MRLTSPTITTAAHLVSRSLRSRWISDGSVGPVNRQLQRQGTTARHRSPHRRRAWRRAGVRGPRPTPPGERCPPGAPSVQRVASFDVRHPAEIRDAKRPRWVTPGSRDEARQRDYPQAISPTPRATSIGGPPLRACRASGVPSDVRIAAHGEAPSPSDSGRVTTRAGTSDPSLASLVVHVVDVPPNARTTQMRRRGGVLKAGDARPGRDRHRGCCDGPWRSVRLGASQDREEAACPGADGYYRRRRSRPAIGLPSRRGRIDAKHRRDVLLTRRAGRQSGHGVVRP